MRSHIRLWVLYWGSSNRELTMLIRNTAPCTAPLLVVLVGGPKGTGHMLDELVDCAYDCSTLSTLRIAGNLERLRDKLNRRYAMVVVRSMYLTAEAVLECQHAALLAGYRFALLSSEVWAANRGHSMCFNAFPCTHIPPDQIPAAIRQWVSTVAATLEPEEDPAHCIEF